MSETAYVAGIILCPLGVCLTAKSGFGVSMVVAPAYVLSQKISGTAAWFTFGKAEYILQGMLLLVLGIVLKKFKWKYLLSFVTAFIYGNILDFWFNLLGEMEYDILWQKMAACTAGIIINALAIAFFLRTYLPQEAYEMFVKEIAEGFCFKITVVKWIFDILALILAIVFMLMAFRKFAWNIVGWNTFLAAAVNAPLIGVFGKFLDSRFEFDSAFPRFYEKFQELMN